MTVAEDLLETLPYHDGGFRSTLLKPLQNSYIYSVNYSRSGIVASETP